ncbi:hypothetical protein Tco_0281768 [Tanacetum coccineum]
MLKNEFSIIKNELWSNMTSSFPLHDDRHDEINLTDCSIITIRFPSIDDDSFSIDDIENVEASPPDSELVSLEVVEIVISELGGIDIDILQTIKDELFVNTLFFLHRIHIEVERTSGFVPLLLLIFLIMIRSSLNHFESIHFHLPIMSGLLSCGSSSSNELASIIFNRKYDCFYFKNEPELGDFMMDVVEDIFDNQTMSNHWSSLPNVFAPILNLHLDSDFTLSIQSKIFLLRDGFSNLLSLREPPLPVIDTLLPFSSENENKVLNPGILAAGKEKSPHLSSHRGLKALNEIPMMISGGDIPNLDVPFLHFYPPMTSSSKGDRSK